MSPIRFRTMPTPPNYRQLAERSLGQAAAQLNTLPAGRVSSESMLACSANAQAVASIAIAQALIDLADAVRAQHPLSEYQHAPAAAGQTAGENTPEDH
jgi:hypothetical protein